ncbi:MAG: Gfo/Idh/MocA family oxidoreductase [Lachnospiraceae bacterium]|jgi:predicted dehydrogenase|nr:Gfo/Idh/MocA family oxidoreductase [Lachnospiraceae bacterium]
MKYALIGCGRIAKNHLIAAEKNNLEIVAVCDVDLPTIENLLDTQNLHNSRIKRYVDYKHMLQAERPHLVSVATSSGSHAEIVMHLIKCGIPVIVEKPMAMSIVDANRIIGMAEERNVKVSVCHQNRFNLAVKETKKAIESGRFGKMSHGSVHVRWNRNEDYYNQSKWRGTWENDGGTLINQCLHGIDLLLWLFDNEVDEVYGQTRRQFHEYIETEDVGLAIVKFVNGAIATIEGTVNVFPQNLEGVICLFGKDGTVKLGGKSCNSIDIWKFADEQASDSINKALVENTSNVYGNGHILLFADMIEAIENDRQPYVSAREGKRAIELILAIYKSQKEGRPIKLPLHSFSTMDMKGEF